MSDQLITDIPVVQRNKALATKPEAIFFDDERHHFKAIQGLDIDKAAQGFTSPLSVILQLKLHRLVTWRITESGLVKPWAALSISNPWMALKWCRSSSKKIASGLVARALLRCTTGISVIS